jgi:hypothetical protein
MVVHGVWTCNQCDAGRTCRDPETLAERHAEDTGHETSAERTVFSIFGEESDKTGESVDLLAAGASATGEHP